MCLLITLVLLGPRAVIFVYWIGWPARWEQAFDSFIVPLLGFIVFPWTTLIYLGVGPSGISGGDYFLLALGVVADLASFFGGGSYSRMSRDRAYGPYGA